MVKKNLIADSRQVFREPSATDRSNLKRESVSNLTGGDRRCLESTPVSPTLATSPVIDASPPCPLSCFGLSPLVMHFVDVSHRASHTSRRTSCVPPAFPRPSIFVDASPGAVNIPRPAVTVDILLVARSLDPAAAVAGQPTSRAFPCAARRRRAHGDNAAAGAVVEAPSTANDLVTEAAIRGSDGTARSRRRGSE